MYNVKVVQTRAQTNSIKLDTMVKNKRDLKSPHRNRSFTGRRSISCSRPASGANGGNIRVVVRVRPLNEREDGNNSRNIIKIVDDNTMVFDPKEEDEPFFYHGVQQRNRDIMKRGNKNLHFTFDRVFGFDSDNDLVFQNSTKCLIDTLMKGYNCSVFVYGATGAGKTHTMLGCGDDPGITFLTMQELFQRRENLSQERDFEIGMTYLEVYNETVQDLLNPGPALHLREDGKYGVIVAGIKMQRIEEPEKLFALLEQGNLNRTQHPTDANAESSRSHAVFQVYLKMKFKASGEIRVAKLSMIDLAGSERGAATGYSGARFTEGANINKSLLALGNCINSLADGHRHVPYRDSKLTRLLKDSLGGNCQTIMVANISPSSLTYEDTYNTLKYATRAKKIKSNMKKNIVNCEVNINHYIKLVDELTKENAALKLQISMGPKPCSSAETIVKEEPNRQLEEELQTLYADKRELEQRIAQLESAKQLMSLRKHLKEESDARLSGICSDTPEKKHGHFRLGNAVERLERQATNIQQEILNLRKRNQQIETKLLEFLQKAPYLQPIADREESQITFVVATNKAQHLQKVCDLQAGELRMRDQLIERFSEVLQPCFLQLRGHGHATEALTTNYRELVKHLQGIRSVTWDDETDSGVSSTTNLIDEEPQPKRKLPKDASLDRTFVLPSGNLAETLMTKVYDPMSTEETNENICPSVCAADLMVKVYTPSPDQDQDVPMLDQTRVLSKNPTKENILVKQLQTKGQKRSPAVKKVSPRILTENKPAFRSRPVLNGNSLRFGSAQEKAKNLKSYTFKPPTASRSRSACARKPLGQ